MVATALVVSLLAVTPSPCTHGQLRVQHGSFNGSAGHFHWPLVFRNVSASPCTLRGFPGVSSRSSRHGQGVGVPAARERTGQPRRVVLAARGGTASALFTQVDTGVFDAKACHPKLARGLRIYAPDQRRFFYARLRHRACSTPPAGQSDSSIRAVVPGATGL